MAGSIRQRGPGRWQVRVSAGRDPATGRYRYVTASVEGGTRDAQRAAAKLEHEVRQGRASGGRGTVSDLLEKWMAHLEAQGRAPTTTVRYRSAIDVRVAPALGHVKVADLTAADLDARAAAAGTTITPQGFVWSQEVDASKPYRPIRVSGTFRSVRDKLGIAHVTFHGLRHFSATALEISDVA